MVRSSSGAPTAALEDIPQELLDRFCKLADFSTLKSLRLTNKAFGPAAAKTLFGHVEVLPTAESANKCLELMSSAKLSGLVKNLAFRTAIDPAADNEDAVPSGWDMNDGLVRDENNNMSLPKPCYSVLSSLGSFKELQDVSLTFSEHVNGESEDYYEAREEMDFRDAVLRSILSSFGPSNAPKKFHRLSIKNLQDKQHPVFVADDGFKALLACLDSLSLQIATQTDDANPDVESEMPELHEFFNRDLKIDLLAPNASNLRELKLFTTCGLNTHVYWGQYPGCDLRDIHFPQLQLLALGNFSFSYDWQLDWILSHAETLETLVLDDCPIVIYGQTSDEMQHYHVVPENRISRNGEEYDEDGDGEDDPDDEISWAYDGRWHTYFRRIKDTMINLKHFGINCYNHNDSTEHDAFNVFKVGAELSVQRYRIFSEGRLEWPADFHNGGGYAGDVDVNGELASFGGLGVAFPVTWEEDQAALEELLEVVNSRK